MEGPKMANSDQPKWGQKPVEETVSPVSQRNTSHRVQFSVPSDPPFSLLRGRAIRFCSPKYLDNESTSLQRRPLDLPLFGSLRHCHIEFKPPEKLWTLEIERLVEIVEGEAAMRPMLVPSPKPGEEALMNQPLNDGTFEQLRLRADNIFDALQICILDDQALLSGLTETWLERGQRSYRALNQRWTEHVGLVNLPGHRGRSRTKDWTTNRQQADEGGNVEFFCLNHTEIDQCLYIVDQIAATIAVLAFRCKHNDYWYEVVMACLAKLSTKLKFLIGNMSSNISSCLDRHCDEFEDQPLQQHVEFGSDDGEDKDEEPLVAESPIKTRYCREFDTTSTWLTNCFAHCLKGLGSQKTWWTKSAQLDMCVMIYAAGVKGTPTLLHQDRRGEISALSAGIPLSFSLEAMTLVRYLAKQLITPQTDSRIVLDIELNHKIPLESFHVATIKDLVVTNVALSLSHPRIGQEFQHNLHIISSLPVFGKLDEVNDNPSKSISSKHGEPLCAFISLRTITEGGKRRTSSSLSTSHIAAIRHNVFSRGCVQETGPTTQATIWDNLAMALVLQPRLAWKSAADTVFPATLPCYRGELPSTDKNQGSSTPATATDDLLQATEVRKKLQAETDNWRISENSIVISCPKYVCSVLLLSAIVVIIGLACGFLVGDRVTGVDPFNFTMFSWILSGLFLLVAKSTRVSEWPWRDFLFMRVTCRTVKEVHSVTRLDPQHILVFLLSTEIRSILRTGGPFQDTFFRSNDPDGFSIDVRPTLQTLLASGIIPVTVGTVEGPALRFLRTVPGYKSCVALNMSGTAVGLTCRDPPSHNQGVVRYAALQQRKVAWIKVLGFYNATEVEFQS